ncbi:MAG TPA: GerMN domain-containing protein [Clostridia bacterium]|nr:GerMN domain-containing protein [Clostridia bacterium]
MRRIVSVITICFIILAMFSGCGVLQKLGLEKSGSDELTPASSVVMGETEAQNIKDKVPIHLYFANAEGTKLKLEVRYIPLTDAKKSVNHLAGVIVKELIKGPEDSNLKATIPKDTVLRSTVKINKGVATVDLTRDFVDKHPGGATAEKLTIFSLVNSLTELKDIEKVRFLIGGKQTASFKGNFQFDAPFPRNAPLISTETQPPSTSGNDQKQPEQKKPEQKKDNVDKKTSTDEGNGDSLDVNQNFGDTEENIE